MSIIKTKLARINKNFDATEKSINESENIVIGIIQNDTHTWRKKASFTLIKI